jgi:hypothetical protein
LPAFIYEDGELIIPFNLNQAVGRKEFSKIAILIRSVQTNVEKY